MITYDEVIAIADEYMKEDYDLSGIKSRQVKCLAKAIVKIINNKNCNCIKPNGIPVDFIELQPDNINDVDDTPDTLFHDHIGSY